LNAEIIAVGTEILLGEIVNTNSKYISEKLANIGINVYYQSVVGDNEARLTEIFSIAYKRSDLIILTGGLGPTEDDITKEVISKAIGKPLLEDKEVLKSIYKYFENTEYTVSENTKKQALVPEGAFVLENDNGTAPGILIQNNSKVIILLPGPPNEIVPMFNLEVIPYLKKTQTNILYSTTLKLINIGEAQVEEGLKDLISLQQNPTIATYAKIQETTIRLTAKSKNEKDAIEAIKPVKEEIYKRYSNYIYGENEETLESIIVNKLIQKNMTVSFAESLTGGMLCATLINYPTASKVLMEGLVTYSNESKVLRLGVKNDTLSKYGAVSKEVAIEMAEYVAKTSKTNIGVSTTGIAGPGGGSKQKPVGTVYVAVYINGKTKVQHFLIKGDREKIRLSTTQKALNMIFEYIK
jgi:nicotinamide-nucleotide amidase